MTAFVVETGEGLSAATSYVSVAEADLVAADTIAAAVGTWNELLPADKEYYLKYATAILDRYAAWNGDKTEPLSRLRWPRSGVYDCDRLPVAIDVVPRGVKEATIELAFFYSVASRSAGARADNEGLKRLKVDVIELEWQEGFNANTSLQFPLGLNHFLCGLGTFRGNRVHFAPISKV